MEKILSTALTWFLVVVTTSLAFAHDDRHDIQNDLKSGSVIPQAALGTIGKSQGVVEIRIERLDGTMTYRRGSGFLVDAEAGFVVAPLDILPNFKAAIEDSDAISFYKMNRDDTFKKIKAYVYATSEDYKLTILKLDGKISEDMNEVVFSENLSSSRHVYAMINKDGVQRDSLIRFNGMKLFPFQGHIVDTLEAAPVREDIANTGTHIYLDAPVELSGEVVVDSMGRVIGIGTGMEHGHTALVKAPVIQKALAEVRQAEQHLMQRGAITPSETYAIRKLTKVFEEIMLLYAARTLEPPRSLSDCAYEMFAIKSSGACRDAFSTYLTPLQARQRQRLLEENLGGIGLKIVMQDGGVEVVTPFNNTPASRAGIQPGDILKKVDGRTVTSVDEAVALFQGPPGSEVDLTLWRRGELGDHEELRVTAVRERITLKTVTTQIVNETSEERAGLVTIHQFREHTADQFEEAVAHFLAQDIKNIIVDVRNNPGGSLRAVVKILALFMEPDDTVLVLRERNAEHRLDFEALTETYGIHTVGTFRKLHVAVLINRGSASAAEIFAGTLQDWGYPVVGERSFGKGVVQSPITLGDDSMFIMTTSEFLVGNHHLPIRNRGVLPNFEVENLPAPGDEQLKKATALLLTAERVALHGKVSVNEAR